MLDSTNKTATSKPANSPKTNATQAFRVTAENGSAQAKEAFEKMSAATAEATGLIKDCYSTALKGAQDYNAKVIELNANTEAVIALPQKACWREIAVRFHRNVDRTLTQEDRENDRATKELAALAQKVTLATVEPLKTGVSKAFGQPN